MVTAYIDIGGFKTAMPINVPKVGFFNALLLAHSARLRCFNKTRSISSQLLLLLLFILFFYLISHVVKIPGVIIIIIIIIIKLTITGALQNMYIVGTVVKNTVKVELLAVPSTKAIWRPARPLRSL